METVTEISGSQFLKEDHILTNLTDFLANGNLFLFFQTAVNCYQWKQFIIQLEHIFQSILHSRLVLTNFLFTGNIIVLF